MGLLTILDRSAAIEETIGEIYRRLAATVDCDGSLRKIWLQMAQDEDAHAAQLRLARRLTKAAELTQSHLSDGEIEILARRAESVLAEVAAEPPSLDEALLLSVELEQSFLRLHAPNSLALGATELRVLFLSLARADGEHLDALRSYQAERRSLLEREAGRSV